MEDSLLTKIEGKVIHVKMYYLIKTSEINRINEIISIIIIIDWSMSFLICGKLLYSTEEIKLSIV